MRLSDGPIIRATVSLADIAQRLGVPIERLYANMAKLRASGFPAPLPGLGKRYDPLAVRDWQDAQRAQNAAMNGAMSAPGDSAEDPDIIAARRLMDARAGF